MSLSEQHQAELTKYLQYFQKKRLELETELDSIRDEFIDAQLNEDLYNKKDVLSDDGRSRISWPDCASSPSCTCPKT